MMMNTSATNANYQYSSPAEQTNQGDHDAAAGGSPAPSPSTSPTMGGSTMANLSTTYSCYLSTLMVAPPSPASVSNSDDSSTSRRSRSNSITTETEATKTSSPKSDTTPSAVSQQALQPHPFFFYKDHSRDQDPDPLYPLVPPGKVPNFPAKMHAILSRQELTHIVAWLPHGRSWQILKPGEFELIVIPQVCSTLPFALLCFAYELMLLFHTQTHHSLIQTLCLIRTCSILNTPNMPALSVRPMDGDFIDSLKVPIEIRITIPNFCGDCLISAKA